MKKKVFLIILMVSVVGVSVFAGVQQRVYRTDDTQTGVNYNPTYVELSDGTYKNVETDQILSADELPEYCRLVGGDGQMLYQRNQYNSNTRNSRSGFSSNRSFGGNSSRRAGGYANYGSGYDGCYRFR